MRAISRARQMNPYVRRRLRPLHRYSIARAKIIALTSLLSLFGTRLGRPWLLLGICLSALCAPC
jgi:hypothetical protein